MNKRVIVWLLSYLPAITGVLAVIGNIVFRIYWGGLIDFNIFLIILISFISGYTVSFILCLLIIMVILGVLLVA